MWIGMELRLAVPGSRAGVVRELGGGGGGGERIEGRRLMKMVLLLFCPFSGDGKFSELQSSMAERRLRTPDLGR